MTLIKQTLIIRIPYKTHLLNVVIEFHIPSL